MTNTTMKASCSNCGASFALKDRSMEGKKVKCKKCGKPFVISFDDGGDDEWGGGGMAMPPVTMPPKMGEVKKKKKSSEAPSGGGGEKKTKSKKGGGGPGKAPIIIGGCLLGGVLIWTVVMVAMSSPDDDSGNEIVPVQVQYERKKSETGKFSVDVPIGWSFKTGGGTGGYPEFVRIETEDISISIKFSLKASALGDIAGAGGIANEEELPDDLEPIAQVHGTLMNDMKVEMSNYQEEPMEKIETKAGNARLSKFTGDRGAFDGGMAYGIRATVPASPDNLIVKIICESQNVFDRHEQVLREIILSIGR